MSVQVSDVKVRSLAAIIAELDEEQLLAVIVLAASYYALKSDTTPRGVYDLLFKVDLPDEEWRRLFGNEGPEE